MMKRRAAVLIIGSVIVALAGCSDDSNDSAVSTELSPTETSEDAEHVPDAEQLAAMLLSEADLDGGWEVNPWGLPPTQSDSIRFGESKFRALVCDDAPEEFRAAEEALHWHAFVHLDKAGGVAIEELLWADEPGAAASLYAILEEGLDACMGKPGHHGTPEPLTVPEVGDERTGLLIRAGEPGAEASMVYGVLVRDGPVLMSAQTFVTMRGQDVEPEVGDEQVEQIFRTMADKIAEAARARAVR